jgi:hypothetical protein
MLSTISVLSFDGLHTTYAFTSLSAYAKIGTRYISRLFFFGLSECALLLVSWPIPLLLLEKGVYLYVCLTQSKQAPEI